MIFPHKIQRVIYDKTLIYESRNKYQYKFLQNYKAKYGPATTNSSKN